MTSKEYAKQLCLKYQSLLFINASDKEEDAAYISQDSKQCAIIAIDELLNIISRLAKPEYVEFLLDGIFDVAEREYSTHLHGYEVEHYLEKVKTEIEAL